MKIIPKQGVPQCSHRSGCVLRTEAPGRHRTQTRTQASPAVAESEARLAVGFLVVDNSGSAAADSESADSVMRQFRRPISLSTFTADVAMEDHDEIAQGSSCMIAHSQRTLCRVVDFWIGTIHVLQSV